MKYITKSNLEELAKELSISSEILKNYTCVYQETVPCNVKEKGGSFFLVTDKSFDSKARLFKFKESTNFVDSIELSMEKFDLKGYKNFGSLDLDGDRAYYVAIASKNEDIKLPSNLDYFRISELEYTNKVLLKDNMEDAFIVTMSVQSSINRFSEQEKIKYGMLGKEPPSASVSLASILGIEEEKEEEEDKGTELEKEKASLSLMGAGDALKNKTKDFSFALSKPHNNYENDYNEDEDYDEDEEEGRGGLLGILDDFGLDSGIMKKLLMGGGILVGVIVIFMIVSSVLSSMAPSTEKVDLAEYYGLKKKTDVVLVYNGKTLNTRGLYLNDSMYVTYEFAHDYLNDRLYYDSNEELMLYATSTAMIEMREGSKSITVGGGKQTLKYPAYQKTNDGTVWVNLDFIDTYSAFTYTKHKSPYRAVITNYSEDTTIDVVTTTKESAIRSRANKKAPILTNVNADQALTLLENDGGWAKVSSLDGIIGYIDSSHISSETTKTIKKNTYDEEFSHNIYNSKICLLWHQITNKSANNNVTSVLDKADGINIICPTWFYINDSKGTLADLASLDYVEKCHQRDVLVWGLFSNLENPTINTSEILNSTSTRRTLVNNIVVAAKKYKLDGINIDFEALSGDVGDSFIQFIRELALALDDTNIVLSVDNYVPSDYTNFYNRSDQAKFADYVVVMAYDEHTNSTEAGSVASLPWVKEGLENTLKDVPKNQLLLGIPLYTRVWKTADGKLTSEAVGIEAMMKIISERNANTTWDKKLGQFYATYTNDNNQYCEVWLEEANSIGFKLDLMRENNIAGAAFWKAGLEPKELWTDIMNGFIGQKSATTQQFSSDALDVQNVVDTTSTDAMDVEIKTEDEFESSSETSGEE